MSFNDNRTNSNSAVTMSSDISSPLSIFVITEFPLLKFNESSSADELVFPESTTSSLPTRVNPTLVPSEDRKLSVAYTVSEAIVSLLAIFGNALVVYIFCRYRNLRRYPNYYIVALAIADFLVGLLGIPFAILASVGQPRNLYGCLFTVSILMVLCTVSILCLVAVSIDRYWATTNPFAYYRNMTTTTAVSIILFCWVAGAIIGFLPLFGWYNREGWERDPPEFCFFTDVMDYSYLVFLYFATIVFPALLMIGFYGYIYHVVLIKIRQKGSMAPQHLRRFSEQSRTGSLNCENRSATQAFGAKRREAKAAKKLGIIVLFFMLCWMPLYTINCITAFYPGFQVPIGLLNFTIILSHANSALNPFLYAYHLKEFRLAMKKTLLTLIGKLMCGLVHIHVERDNPLGPMSRSVTMHSIGHVTTIPNPTGKASKFRKISRPDEQQLRCAQISPTNINSMIPKAVISTASRDNLLRTTGGMGKSLTSLSLASDASNQILEIPLTNTISTCSTTPKHIRSKFGKKGKRNGHGSMYNHLMPPALIATATVAHTFSTKSLNDFEMTCYNSSSAEIIENCITTFTKSNNRIEMKKNEEGDTNSTNPSNSNDLSKTNDESVVKLTDNDEHQGKNKSDNNIQESEQACNEHEDKEKVQVSPTPNDENESDQLQHVKENLNEDNSSKSSHDHDTSVIVTQDGKSQQNCFDKTLTKDPLTYHLKTEKSSLG